MEEKYWFASSMEKLLGGLVIPYHGQIENLRTLALGSGSHIDMIEDTIYLLY